MIVDQKVDILKYWNSSGRQLMIKAKAGNDKTGRAKDIMNQMIKEGCSIILLTNHRSSWVYELDKSPKTLIGKYKFIIDEPDAKKETDLLVIDDSREMSNEFPINSIKFKYILILSDESGRAPLFFKGKIVALIDWDNLSNMSFGEDGSIYTASSDHEGTITLIKQAAKRGSEKFIDFPVEMLKEILLK